MNPAAAMGTFIRTWRAEWAGLSRAQVAIAANGKLGRRRHISGETVRRWEEGQPPKSTEELEALCQVMARHGLLPLELKQFRQAVFAACADRQFPELFPDDEWVYTEDVTRIAQDVDRREDRVAGSVSIVELVARVSDLTNALRNGNGNGVSRAQAERQKLAFVHLMTPLTLIMQYRNRNSQAAARCASLSAFLDVHFDGRPPYPGDWGSGEWEVQRLQALAWVTKSPAPMERMLEIQRDATRTGSVALALRAARTFANEVSVGHGTQKHRDAAWQLRCNLLPRVFALSDPQDAASFHHAFANVAIRVGALDEADQHAEHFQCSRETDGMRLGCLHLTMARLAEAKGDYAEAIAHYEARWQIDRRWSYGGSDYDVRRCEAKLQKANRRKKRTNSSPKGKTNQSGKKRKK